MSDGNCPKCGRLLGSKERLRRDMCFKCYRRWVEDPSNGDKVRRLNRPVLERLKEKSIAQADGCIYWTGHLNANGYGRLNINGQMVLAHRAMYMEAVGPIPAGSMIDHVCHNGNAECKPGPACKHRRCINPEHLEPVTNNENQLRSIHTTAYRGANIAECSKGHAIYRTPGGSRRCRDCERERREQAAAASPPSSIREFCGNGHRMTVENTLVRGKYARCRACDAARARKYRARRKGA
ncbi:HNH endonuclease signature motif containing protein [Streptomyces sp. NPDC059016]|uniref:HNH endonuclease signature motif containing protein n=1 Tax=Streptomyces sp. NPDC059016 TaxID=3346699 RepID=UPI0036B90E1B